MMTKKNEHVIKEVYPGSIAQEMEIEPGDILLSINHEVIEDVFDYRYLIKDEYIEVVIRKPDGEEWLLEIDKEYDDDLGVEFENGEDEQHDACVEIVTFHRCRRECGRPCILRTTIPGFLSCREITLP